MHTPTVIHGTSMVVTPRGHLAVQLSRVRGIVRGLNAADHEWAGDTLLATSIGWSPTS